MTAIRLAALAIGLTVAPLAACSTGPALAPPAEAAMEAIEPGQVAPDFTLKDLDGTAHTLSALKGKTVVLEWFNPGCPFVVHAHDEGPLNDLAAKQAGDDLVWLAINSGAPGKQGHGVEANKKAVADWKIPHPVLLDEDGTVGRAYGAKSTPQMVVVGPDGKVAYNGALDNAPLGKTPATGYLPHFAKALTAVRAGEAPSPAKTQPYGCSVKY